jgi:DNA-binding transcriptional regulator PaaX
MRGDKLLQMLESIAGASRNAGDFFGAFLSAGYGASRGKLRYEISRRERNRTHKDEEFSQEKELRDRYHAMMYKLKRDGIIVNNNKKNKKEISLTVAGRDKLLLLRKHSEKQLPPSQYKKETSARVVIIMFDIPEKERRKRDWLRSALKNLGLEGVQKSVWIGKVKIPKDFLDDLLRLKLVEFVEILEVTKFGTIKQRI